MHLLRQTILHVIIIIIIIIIVIRAGVFGLMGCSSLFPSLVLSTFFNNNNEK